ncbi:MAG: translocation/assembly module TamB domain-containing protein [Cytophagales bacterium]
MKRGAAKLQRIFKGIFKSLVYLIFALILLVGIIGLISRSSFVQTYIVQKITSKISSDYNVDISVGKFYLSGFRTLNLRDALIRDHHQDTMIYVKSLSADVSLKNIFANNTLYLSDIELFSPYFYLHKTKEDSTFNINYFTAKLSPPKAPDTLKKDQFKVSLEKVHMNSGTFILEGDTVRPVDKRQFNPDYIRFNKINADLQYLIVHFDSVLSDIDSLNFVDERSQNSFDLLHTNFRMTSSNMLLYNTDISFNKSHIKDSLQFYFTKWPDWSDFNEKIEMKLSLDQSRIWTGDINYFVPIWNGKNENFLVKGKFQGFLNSFNFKDLSLVYGRNSYLNGDLSIEGLPEVDNSIISLKINSSHLNMDDLKGFFNEEARPYLKNLNYVDLNGNFDGFYYDFVADGEFKTGLGTVRSDMNLKVPETGPAKYSGKLSSRNFKLGKLIGREDLVKTINIKANVNGKGFNAKEADMQMEATLSKSVIYGYQYNEIKFNAHLKENLFDGSFNVKDSALNVVLNGLVNLDPEIEKIDIQGEIINADLDRINLSEKEGFVKGKVDLDFAGLTFDKTSGYGNLSDIEVFYDDKYLELDTMSIISQLTEGIRNIEINSDLFNANIKGNFKLKSVYNDFQMILKEYQLQIVNDDEDIKKYYSSKIKSDNKYSAEWYIDFNDINPIVSLFYPEFYISTNTKVEGRFSVGNTNIFNLLTSIDTLIYDNYQFYNNEFDLSSSKYADSSEILAFAYVFSEKQIIPNVIEGKDLMTELLWNDNKINFESAFRQFDDSNFVNFAGRAIFKIDSTVLSFTESDFKIFENNWDIEDQNRVVFKQSEIKIENLNFNSKYESISINGSISRNPEAVLEVDFKDFNLRNFNPLIGRNISGVLNSDLSFINIYNQFQTYGTIRANDCTIEGFLVGDIAGTSEWDNSLNAIVSKFTIDRLGKKILELEGRIVPAGDSTELNIVAKLNSTNLNIIEPFASDLISNINGVADGYLNLNGTTSQPVLKGWVAIKDGGMLVNYLNTYYSFSDRLVFNTDNISARDLVLKDKNGNQAILNGGIFHDGFTNFVIDLSASLNRFEILNTSSDDNNLYYGNAFASGSVNFLGSFSDIQISADLQSERGTYVYIPTDNYTELEKQSHITFLSELEKEDDGKIIDEFNVDLSGVSMNLNLNITPEARMEIILDRQTGDIIKGQGQGELSLEIDTRGEFNMYGFYEIEKGSYNFTLLNIVNKEFNVKEGGRISWSGDPYQGQLDLTGTYTQSVPLKPLMESADSIFLNSPQATRRSPVSVNLHLTGPLLNPEFEFGIDIIDPPIYQGYDFNNDLLAFQNKIQNNRDYLNRQVFSLIVLRQFSQEESNYQQPAGRNLSELLTNQLSNYVSSVNENLEINFDLSGLSQEDLNDLQLRLSYTFLEGRLRVTREGGFTNSTNETDVSTIIGDWTIEYALTQDGQLKAKMFNRNNSNVYQPGARSTNTTGLSVLYTKSFDDFVEFLKKEEKAPKKKKIPLQKIDPAKKEETDTPTIEQQ